MGALGSRLPHSRALAARVIGTGVLCGVVVACESRAVSSEQADRIEPSADLGQLDGQVVFQSDIGGDWDIYLLDLDDGERPTPKRLTVDEADDLNPSFSEDGNWIVFSSTRSGGGDLYLMDRNGESLRRLTDHPAYEGAPQFARDGQWILFEGERDGSSEIYRVSRDGTDVDRLTNSSTRKLGPTLAPDGRHFAYMEKSWIRWHVSLQNWDSGEVSVVSGDGGACRPAFSPDGRWLAYVGTEEADKTDIWVFEMSNMLLAAKETTERFRVRTRPDAHNYDPSFSRDGRHIAFASTRARGREEQWDLFVSDTNGRGLIQLTETDANERFPVWAASKANDSLSEGLDP